MALTTVELSWTQTADGNKVIFRDDTDYVTAGVDPAECTRMVQVYSNKDATGTLLSSLVFTGSELTVEMDLDEDKYLSAKLTVDDGVVEPLTDIINFGTTVNEYNSLNNILLRNSCGCNKDTDQSVRFGFIYLKMAEKAVIFGNSGAFNRYIDLSRTWLAN